MGRSKVTQTLISFKWLSLKKFCYFFSLQTGIQIYGFSSFIVSALVTDVLLIEMIDRQLCEGFHSDDIQKCIATKHILVPQACLAFMSALLLWALKRPSVPLSWIGCKLVVGVIQLGYFPEWSSDLFFQFFKIFLAPAWFAVIFITLDLYGVLITVSYHTELIESHISSTITPKDSDLAEGIPIPPDLPSF